tara:strand:+ start:174 stop:1142 length:969 start_codon:yes stop_codon:yes gene_type:complete
VISKNYTAEQDVRPIGQRRRKWERIKKVNDDCYLFVDSYGFGDDVFGRDWAGGTVDPTIDEQIMLAPMVWKRVDGQVFLKVRNGTGLSHAHTGRYYFLTEFLPRGLNFVSERGKQYVAARGKDGMLKRHYLPKSVTCGPSARAELEKLRQNGPMYAYRAISDYEAEDDGAFLVFKCVGDRVWQLVSEPLPEPVKQTRVDKEAKAKLKPYLDTFWEWACAYAPLLPTFDYQYVSKQLTVLNKYNLIGSPHWHSDAHFHPEETIEVLKDVKHEAALPLLVFYLSESDLKDAADIEDLRKCRAHFNNWANRVCGLVTTTTVYKGN